MRADSSNAASAPDGRQATDGAAPGKDRLLRALAGLPVDMTPVWLMRQAGRYLPEYRAVRERVTDFTELIREPELACEVALQPLRRFALDAAILFSDILTIPDALGLGLYFAEGEGPRFERPVRSVRDVHALAPIEPERDLAFVQAAARMTCRELGGRLPLIGFCGSPWTLAAYMVEGGASADFRRVRALAGEQPELLHALLDRLAQDAAAALAAQIAAGVQVVQIFDTWGGVLSAPAYREFSLRSIARLIERLAEMTRPGVPVIVFSKGTGQWLRDTARCGCDALSLDWTSDLGVARQALGDGLALQGNMDPALLRCSAPRVREEVARVLEAAGPAPGHVFNLGHGIYPDTDPEQVAALVDAVHELSAVKP